MKRRLNILCAIVLLVMGWSVGVSVYYMGLGMTKGVQMGMNAAREQLENGNSVQLERVSNLRTVSLLPRFLDEWEGDLFTDSVRNEKTGRYVPMAYTNLMVSVPVEAPAWQKVVSTLMGFLVLVGSERLGVGTVHPSGGVGQPFGHLQLAQRPSPAPSGRAADCGLCLRAAARISVALQPARGLRAEVL